MVLSSKLRSDKSCSSVASPLSSSGNLRRIVLEILLVRVPAVVVDGDVRNAFFNQPPGGQAGLPELVLAVLGPQFVLLLRQIKNLSPVAQNQVIRLLFGLLGCRQLRIARQGVLQRVQFLQQVTPVFLPLLGDAGRDDAFHRKRRFGRIAARGERFVTRPQKARLGKSSLRLGQHDIRRNQSLDIRRRNL